MTPSELVDRVTEQAGVVGVVDRQTMERIVDATVQLLREDGWRPRPRPTN